MKNIILPVLIIILITLTMCENKPKKQEFASFQPPISYEQAEKRADSILSKMSLEEKIQIIGGEDTFFIKGFEKYKIPRLYLSDATQGVHIRKSLSQLLEKSTAFPCPLALSATWNPDLAQQYSKSIGEECRAGDIAILLGPGMNIYRISQNGRNFEYFGEDPFLAARMIENYVVGVQSTGTITTLKHFLCNNNEYYRRTTNAVVDERTLHEIYLPAFKAGIDAGAMAVMTSYNQVDGEWAGQSQYVISDLLQKQLGFKWLVMSDWWSTWDPEKVIKSGQDLEMPGFILKDMRLKENKGDYSVKANAMRLVKEGKVTEADINRMAKHIITTCIAMGIYDRPVKDEKYLQKFPDHEKVALQTAREAIVLLRNENNILPINKDKVKKILLTGDYVEKLARGLGSAEVEGYDNVSMLDAFTKEFGDKLEYIKNPTGDQIKTADVVLLSIGTQDGESLDRPFEQPESEKKVLDVVSKNPHVVVIVNSGSGIQMTNWNEKVEAILYSWYVGQNGNTALAEILSGKTNPSGKLPITIEKKFEDSPGFGYIPKNEKLYTDWKEDNNITHPINTIEYKEGVFVGYRWYDSKNIEPLYHFGFGLSYTTFEYGNIKASDTSFKQGETLKISFDVKNTGKVAGTEVAQLYVSEMKPAVPRPVRELKGFKKISLNPGETKTVEIDLDDKAFAYWDISKKDWNINPGSFVITVGPASNKIGQTLRINVK